MTIQNKQQGIFIAPNRKPWDHEMRVARILAINGHYVEFLPEGNLRCPDISLDGIKYEIKSPESARAITIERALKKALKQSQNLIIDASRIKDGNDDKIQKYLVSQARSRKQIKKMLFVTKKAQLLTFLSLFDIIIVSEASTGYRRYLAWKLLFCEIL